MEKDHIRWEGCYVPNIPSEKAQSLKQLIKNKRYDELCIEVNCSEFECPECIFAGLVGDEEDYNRFWKQLDRFVASKFFVVHSSL